MNRLFLSTILCLVFVSYVSADDAKKSTDSKKQEKITFVDHVLPIFRAKCGSCHNANDRRGGLVLDQYGAMMEGGSSGEVIDPGSAEFSYLWMLVNHEDTPKMPPNASKLPEDELAMIRKWIDLGALENSGSTANIKKKPSLAKIEVTTDRPAEVAVPQKYFGDPAHVLDSKNAVTALTTSPWAPLLAVSGYKQVALYNSKTLASLGVLPFPEGQPQILKFSRNGALLMVGGGRGGQLGKVVLFDVKTGERKVEAGNEYDEVLAADISPDQSLIALGGPKKMLRVYSTATGELVYENKKHTDWVTAIEFSPDGVLLASGDRSNGLVVWEADTGRLFYDLLGHKGAVTDVSWRPDSNVVASSSEDGTVKLWNMQNGALIKSWNAHGGGALALDYTREGNLVSVGRDKLTRMWKGDGAKLKDFGGLKDIGMEVAYDVESKRVISGGWDGIIHLWNADDGKPIGQIDTNPPTAASSLAVLQPKLNEARATHAAKAKALAKITGQLAARQTAANEAVAASQQATKTSNELNAKLASVMKDLAEQEMLLASSNQQLQQTQEDLSQAQSAQKKSEAVAQPAKSALNQQNAKIAQLTAAAKAAQEGVAKASETLQILLKAAEPTAEEAAVIDSNAEVKAALEKRREVAKAAEATVTVATIVATQANSQLDSGKATQKTLQVSFNAANENLKKANVALEEALQIHESAMAASREAKTKVEAAQKSATEIKQKATEARTVANAAKAKADQLVAAAKPSEAEQKQLQTLQAETKQAEALLKSLETQFQNLRAFQDQLAAASESVN